MLTPTQPRRENEDYGDQILSKAVKAGRRTYFFDVRATRGDDWFLTITESRKITAPDVRPPTTVTRSSSTRRILPNFRKVSERSSISFAVAKVFLNRRNEPRGPTEQGLFGKSAGEPFLCSRRRAIQSRQPFDFPYFSYLCLSMNPAPGDGSPAGGWMAHPCRVVRFRWSG